MEIFFYFKCYLMRIYIRFKYLKNDTILRDLFKLGFFIISFVIIFLLFFDNEEYLLLKNYCRFIF